MCCIKYSHARGDTAFVLLGSPHSLTIFLLCEHVQICNAKAEQCLGSVSNLVRLLLKIAFLAWANQKYSLRMHNPYGQ